MSNEFVVVAQGVEALSPKRLLNRYRYQSWDLASAAARVFLEGPQEPGMGAVVLMVREALPEDVEETTLLVFDDPDDLSIYSYAGKPNGAWDTSPSTGVAILHRPSGIETRSNELRSAYANRSAAYCELQVRLHGWTQAEQVAGSGGAPAPIADPAHLEVVGRQCLPLGKMKAMPHYRQLPWVDGDIHQQPSELDLYDVEPLVRLSDVKKMVAQMIFADAPTNWPPREPVAYLAVTRNGPNAGKPFVCGADDRFDPEQVDGPFPVFADAGAAGLQPPPSLDTNKP